MKHGSVTGLPGWMWLFILEGAATVIFGVALRVITRSRRATFAAIASWRLQTPPTSSQTPSSGFRFHVNLDIFSMATLLHSSA